MGNVGLAERVAASGSDQGCPAKVSSDTWRFCFDGCLVRRACPRQTVGPQRSCLCDGALQVRAPLIVGEVLLSPPQTQAKYSNKTLTEPVLLYFFPQQCRSRQGGAGALCSHFELLLRKDVANPPAGALETSVSVFASNHWRSCDHECSFRAHAEWPPHFDRPTGSPCRRQSSRPPGSSCRRQTGRARKNRARRHQSADREGRAGGVWATPFSFTYIGAKHIGATPREAKRCHRPGRCADGNRWATRQQTTGDVQHRCEHRPALRNRSRSAPTSSAL